MSQMFHKVEITCIRGNKISIQMLSVPKINLPPFFSENTCMKCSEKPDIFCHIELNIGERAYLRVGSL